MTNPFFPGTGVPYFNPDFELLSPARDAVRVLCPVGGVWTPLESALPLLFSGVGELFGL